MKISDLKEKLKDYGKTNEQKISEDPEYQMAIAKLRVLTTRRDVIVKELNKIEIDIDMILAMIGANEEKKNLDRK